jgi:hypothetical protein
MRKCVGMRISLVTLHLTNRLFYLMYHSVSFSLSSWLRVNWRPSSSTIFCPTTRWTRGFEQLTALSRKNTPLATQNKKKVYSKRKCFMRFLWVFILSLISLPCFKSTKLRVDFVYILCPKIFIERLQENPVKKCQSLLISCLYVHSWHSRACFFVFFVIFWRYDGSRVFSKLPRFENTATKPRKKKCKTWAINVHLLWQKKGQS